MQPNKAIVGRNAFAHESGIHQDGVLKERSTYEIMDATTVGLDANSIVLGKHSGRHALKSALEELGFEVSGQTLNTAFKRFKDIADKKKQVTALDLEALVTDELRDQMRSYTLEWFDVEASTRRPPHATVELRTPEDELVRGDFTGDGPVDAIFRAINAASKREARLREFHIGSVTGGQDALGEASVVLELAGQSAAGQGVSTDIIEAAALAYVRALSNAERRVLAAAETPPVEAAEAGAHPDAVAWARPLPPASRAPCGCASDLGVDARVVRDDWTRRGLGRAILESCERAARAERFQTLALMATLPGEPLYRASGFQEVGREHHHDARRRDRRRRDGAPDRRGLSASAPPRSPRTATTAPTRATRAGSASRRRRPGAARAAPRPRSRPRGARGSSRRGGGGTRPRGRRRRSIRPGRARTAGARGAPSPTSASGAEQSTSSGELVMKTSRPPGRSSRAASAIQRSGSHHRLAPYSESAKSKLASGSGTASASASISGNSMPCSACIARAVASWPFDWSTPTGRAPRRASQAEK